jgi:hypothetical protein
MDNKKVETQAKPFKRLNFFNGFFTTAQDWQDGETYHMEKRKLHNRGLHTPGVIFGAHNKEQLDLMVEKIPGTKLKIHKGAALDRDGNLIFLAKDGNWDLPGNLLKPAEKQGEFAIVIRFDDSTCAESDKTNDEIPEFTRLTEEPKIDFLCESELANTTGVLLARITVTRNEGAVALEYKLIDQRTAAGAAGLEPIKADIANVRAQLEKLNNNLYEQSKQIDKQRNFHNRTLYSPGVFNDDNQEGEQWKTLRVKKAGPDLVQVAGGAAMDQEGNLLYLPNATMAKLPSDILERCKGDNTIYVALAYNEATDRSSAQEETSAPVIIFLCDPTDIKSAVELARLKVARDGSAIRIEGEPEDRRKPGGTKGLDELRRNFAKQQSALETLIAQVETSNQEQHATTKKLYEYMRTTRQNHYQGLHTPGVVPHVRKELNVVALAGKELEIEVQPGMAIDQEGHELHITAPYKLCINAQQQEHKVVYIVIRRPAAEQTNSRETEALVSSSDEEAQLDIHLSQPNNRTVFELARIHLSPDVKTQGITNPQGEAHITQIDRGNIVWAGAVSAYAPRPIPSDLRDSLIVQIPANRKALATLATKFPTPALDDLRHVLVNLEMNLLAHTPPMDKLPAILTLIVDTIVKGVQELGERYDTIREYSAYKALNKASKAYQQTNEAGGEITDLLLEQNKVAEHAREVADLTLRRPTVTPDQIRYQLKAQGHTANLQLTIEKATAYEGQTIKLFRLEKKW